MRKSFSVKNTIADDDEVEKWHMECAYAYFLELIPGIGLKTIDHLYYKFGSYQNIYKAFCSQEVYDYLSALNVGNKKIDAIKDYVNRMDYRNNYQKEYNNMREENIYCIPKYLVGYPENLKEIDCAPSALFVKGKLPDDKMPLVAIVGARNCSSYGGLAAKELGKKLASSGVGVVSGLARGIDGIGQKAALESGGATFGILGSGVDVCYPEENYDLYKRLCAGENGSGVISEFAPKTAAERTHFPMRNRIISGMADAIVVVEAKEKSGTLITVDRALEQGKNVYAIPGRMTDRLSYGCNRLLSQGAGVIWDLDEFVAEICMNANMKLCNVQIENKKKYVNKMDANYASCQMTDNINAVDDNIAYVNLTQKEVDYNEYYVNNRATEHFDESQTMTTSLTEECRMVLQTLDLQYQSVESILCLNSDMNIRKILTCLTELENKGLVENSNGYYRKRV